MIRCTAVQCILCWTTWDVGHVFSREEMPTWRSYQSVQVSR